MLGKLSCSSFPPKKAFNLLQFRKCSKMLQVKPKIVIYFIYFNGQTKPICNLSY